MPVSSIIVGVDLVSIKPIRNVITLQADITTEKCKQLLRKELQTWKADCVLNDGAPNVGSAWIQDAFSQAHLTLSALRLACDFLREGGWFITKVFRSKDYQPLLWVFQQLFKKVHSTKPQASRNESAEIFVVCQGYIAPDKIDPKILDWKHIFKEVQPEGKRKPSILQPEKKKRAEGYEDGNYTLHKSAAVVDFINSEEPLEFLSSVNSLTFDDKRILRHPLTTEEIKESFNDLKVLGKADIRSILAWQRSIRKELNIKSKEEESDKNEEQEEENEEEMIQKTVQTMQEEEDREEKRKKKKAQVQRQKLKERMQLKMVLPGDTNEIIQEREIFALSHIKNKKELDKVEDVEADDISIENEEDSEMEDDNKYSNSGSDSSDAEEDQVEENEKESRIKDTNSSLHYRERNDEKNPLLVDFIPDEDAKTKTEMWFSKDVFKGLEDEEDEDVEINEMMNEFKKKGGVIIEKGTAENNENIERKKQEKKTKQKVQGVSNDNCNHEQRRENDDDDDDDSYDDNEDDNSEDESESDYDMEAINHPSQPSETKKSTKNKREDFEVVPAESNASVLKKLSAEGLALGAQMAFSRKRRRDIIDNSYHRWTFNDEGLPEWFKEEEAKFYQKQLPVTKEQVDEYKARMREINARPIKKIAEAKAKKKAKALKRLEKARKKAEAICDAVDVTEREKMQQLKTLYKKAGVGKKRKAEPQYVVAKKSLAAKRMKRPAGVKGPYKIVDPRMKKDLRAKQAKDKTKGRGKKTKKGKR